MYIRKIFVGNVIDEELQEGVFEH